MKHKVFCLKKKKEKKNWTWERCKCGKSGKVWIYPSGRMREGTFFLLTKFASLLFLLVSLSLHYSLSTSLSLWRNFRRTDKSARWGEKGWKNMKTHTFILQINREEGRGNEEDGDGMISLHLNEEIRKGRRSRVLRHVNMFLPPLPVPVRHIWGKFPPNFSLRTLFLMWSFRVCQSCCRSSSLLSN